MTVKSFNTVSGMSFIQLWPNTDSALMEFRVQVEKQEISYLCKPCPRRFEPRFLLHPIIAHPVWFSHTCCYQWADHLLSKCTSFWEWRRALFIIILRPSMCTGIVPGRLECAVILPIEIWLAPNLTFFNYGEGDRVGGREKRGGGEKREWERIRSVHLMSPWVSGD